MPESSPNTASSTGAQAADRTYTADEVRVLMADAWMMGHRTNDLSRAELAEARRADIKQLLEWVPRRG